LGTSEPEVITCVIVVGRPSGSVDVKTTVVINVDVENLVVTETEGGWLFLMVELGEDVDVISEDD
jgi:hypothetical protein